MAEGAAPCSREYLKVDKHEAGGFVVLKERDIGQDREATRRM